VFAKATKLVIVAAKIVFANNSSMHLLPLSCL
jgi:hypothetical protein